MFLVRRQRASLRFVAAKETCSVAVMRQLKLQQWFNPRASDTRKSLTHLVASSRIGDEPAGRSRHRAQKLPLPDTSGCALWLQMDITEPGS